MLWDFVQATAGLVALVFAGDILVRGSVSLAEKLGVPSLVIGLTIVAFGTSAPELMVSIDAVLSGVPTLALGNVVGSNIANIFLVVGLPALIAPMVCEAPRLTRNLLIMVAITVLFILLALTGSFGWQQGLVLVTMLVVFIGYNLHFGRQHPELVQDLLEEEQEQSQPLPVWQSSALVLAGLLGLVFGAHLLVGGSVSIARTLGVSEAVIGLTLVALGTSLPELVTSIMAAIRCRCDVAVGNVIGSNIFNLLAIIGISSFFGTIPVPDSFFRVDFWVMLGASVALFPFCLRRGSVGRLMGCLFLLAYGGYMAWLVQSGGMDAMGGA